MAKITVVINGKPGVGKDTLCDIIIRRYRARKISSIDPIVEIARQNGWDGIKDAKSRKFLSDLKRAFAEFNDLPNRYVTGQYQDFLKSDDEVLFVHIRERDQIEAFRQNAMGGCVTLLIRRMGTGDKMGNISDDGNETENEGMYDYSYNNDRPFPEAERDFLNYFAWMLKDTGRHNIRPKMERF